MSEAIITALITGGLALIGVIFYFSGIWRRAAEKDAPVGAKAAG